MYKYFNSQLALAKMVCSTYLLCTTVWCDLATCTIVGEDAFGSMNTTPTTNATASPTVGGTEAEPTRTHITVIIILIIVLFVVILALMITVVIGFMYKRHRYHTQRVSDLSNYDDPTGNAIY